MIVALVLLFLSLNPFTEATEYSDVIVFMLTHYAIFAGGFLLFRNVRLPSLLLFPSAALLILWHLPFLFYLSAKFPLYRYTMEVSVFAAGCMGASAAMLQLRTKAVLLALWLLGDTALAAIFIVMPRPFMMDTAYPLWQFIVLGLIMVLFMNAVIVIILYVLGQRYLHLDLQTEEGSG
ncbi:MAG: DUF1404 family protein [Methanomassiliicoccales archaeon]